MAPVTTTTTKTVFQKAPFRVLATLLVIEGVLIGQVLSRPGTAKETAAATAAQNQNEENCNKLVNLKNKTDCWRRKIKAGEKNLRGVNFSGVDLSRMDLSKADLSGAKLDGIIKDGNTKGLK